MSQRCLAATVILSLFVVGGCASRPGATRRPDPAETQRAAIADTLIRFGREDQNGRFGLARAIAAHDTVTLFRTLRADSARSLWLHDFVREHGWPTRALVGDSAAGAAWLIVQHSPLNDFQREMLPVLEQVAARGDLPRSDLALLTDRVLVHSGQPQRYGSQFNIVDGRFVPDPIGDLPQLDTRRAAVGLPPMSEYVRQLGELYHLPVVWPPTP